MTDLLRDSLAGMHRVWRADDMAHAGELILATSNPVFVIDASLEDRSTLVLVNKVHQQFPDLAIIVAGRREDEALLAPLIASGVIFRRMDKPATAETICNIVDATQCRSGSNAGAPATVSRAVLSAASGATRPAFKLPKFRLPAIKLPKIRIDRVQFRRWTDRLVLLIAMLLTAWVLAQWKPWTYASELFASLLSEPPPPVEIKKEEKLQQLLDAAGIALAKGRLVDPPGKNALELYRAALALDPGNDLAQHGIDNVADMLLAEAEQALQARDMARLASAVDAARAARPDHPRLEFYSEQLRQSRERKAAP